MWTILLIFFLGYEEIDESKMDPPQRKRSNKGPPLPSRWKLMQLMKRNRSPIATVTTPNSNDGAAFDTDSGYEYVANPMKKRHRSAIGKSPSAQGQQQNGDHRRGEDRKSQPNKSNNPDQTKASANPVDCSKIGKSDNSMFDRPIHISHTSTKRQSITETFPIHGDQEQTRRIPYFRHHEDTISSGDKGETEDVEGLIGRKGMRSCNQDLYKYMSSSKGLHLASDDNILYKNRPQKEISGLYKGDKNNDGYQKLIKETMELACRTHEYQKLNKLTTEPHLAITEPQCGRVCHHTI